MTARIRIKRGENELELEGDPSFISEQFDRMSAMAFGATAPRTAPEETELPTISASFRVQKTLSFEDFLSLKEPREEIDRLLCLAYYHEKYGEHVHYSVDELRGLWQEAWPERPLDAIVWKEAIERGFMQWLEEGRLTLSYSGQNYVRNGLA